MKDFLEVQIWWICAFSVSNRFVKFGRYIFCFSTTQKQVTHLGLWNWLPILLLNIMRWHPWTPLCSSALPVCVSPTVELHWPSLETTVTHPCLWHSHLPLHPNTSRRFRCVRCYTPPSKKSTSNHHGTRHSTDFPTDKTSLHKLHLRVVILNQDPPLDFCVIFCNVFFFAAPTLRKK